jgi:hypothetical protein
VVWSMGEQDLILVDLLTKSKDFSELTCRGNSAGEEKSDLNFPERNFLSSSPGHVDQNITANWMIPSRCSISERHLKCKPERTVRVVFIGPDANLPQPRTKIPNEALLFFPGPSVS